MSETRDAFLGGRVQLLQPRDGFRSGSDAVLLAAACPVRPGETVLDLGCGAGAVSACLAARVPGVAVTGVERDAATAALAARNGVSVVLGDVLDLPAALHGRAFHHVVLNPPYFAAGAGSPAADAGREAARREALPSDLAGWCAVAARRAGPRGSVTAIARADRLPDLLAAMTPALGDVRVLPIASRAGRDAKRVIVRGRKGRRSPLRLLAPLVLHSAPAHAADGDDHSPAATAVLRDAAALRLD